MIFSAFLPKHKIALIKQYKALIGTEGVNLTFTDEAIKEIARIAFEVNETVENIGARRLLTVMEKLLDEISFTASATEAEKPSSLIKKMFIENVSELAENADLSKFIL